MRDVALPSSRTQVGNDGNSIAETPYNLAWGLPTVEGPCWASNREKHSFPGKGR